MSVYPPAQAGNGTWGAAPGWETRRRPPSPACGRGAGGDSRPGADAGGRAEDVAVRSQPGGCRWLRPPRAGEARLAAWREKGQGSTSRAWAGAAAAGAREVGERLRTAERPELPERKGGEKETGASELLEASWQPPKARAASLFFPTVSLACSLLFFSSQYLYVQLLSPTFLSLFFLPCPSLSIRLSRSLLLAFFVQHLGVPFLLPVHLLFFLTFNAAPCPIVSRCIPVSCSLPTVIFFPVLLAIPGFFLHLHPRPISWSCSLPTPVPVSLPFSLSYSWFLCPLPSLFLFLCRSALLPVTAFPPSCLCPAARRPLLLCLSLPLPIQGFFPPSLSPAPCLSFWPLLPFALLPGPFAPLSVTLSCSLSLSFSGKLTLLFKGITKSLCWKR
ncbi:uncharacterized protein [Patagioenas fasciata]|uniref:uncharacterized protein n=1 Tax=Patagioenas fasciata TaxID=372321 RepID=UPI003A991953